MNIKKIISILLLVVSVAMIGSGVYIMNSSKYMFEAALTGLFDYLADEYAELSNEVEGLSEYEKYKLNTENVVMMQGIELASITGEMYINSSAKSFYLNLDSEISGDSFIGMEALLSDNKMYAKIKEAMDNFYYEDVDISAITEIEETFDFSQLLKLDEDEFKLLSDHLKDSILKDIGNKDLSKSSETLIFENRNYKTTKISLNISEKRLGNIIENLLASISNDNKAIQILQKFDKTITKDDIQAALDTCKEQANSFSTDEVVSFAFYVEGLGTLRRIEISTLGGEVDSLATTNSALTFDTYNNGYSNKTYLLTLSSGSEAILTMKEEYISDEKANLVIKVDDIEVNGTVENTENNLTANLNLLVSGENLGSLSYKNIIVSEDKEYKTEISVNVSGMFDITSNNTLYINEEIPTIDTNGAIRIDEMTEEDMQELEYYINEKLEALGIFNDDSYEDDYTWDDEDSDW